MKTKSVLEAADVKAIAAAAEADKYDLLVMGSHGHGALATLVLGSITTQVLVNNGETLVLGGIYQQTIKNDVSKVPLLGDIPGLGYLFKKTTSENKKRELLIFVTPRIVTDAL